MDIKETAGIYKSLRSYDRVLFRAEEHLNRFSESIKAVGPVL